MKKQFLQECLQLIFASATFLIMRWFMEISTPQDDWNDVKRWPIWNWIMHPLDWYHQFHGWLILRSFYE